MEDFAHHLGEQSPEPRMMGRQSMDSDRLNMYDRNDNPNQIVTNAPKERFRLGYFDVMCLVVNFMIGK